MSATTKNTKRRQCAKCPWKISTDPFQIPNGYSVEKHKSLDRTIAPPSSVNLSAPLHIMACHETERVPCAGWLSNQLGVGNNLPLRIAVMRGRLSADFELDGDQHPDLESTFPKDGQ
jgi:hypothetical protein